MRSGKLQRQMAFPFCWTAPTPPTTPGTGRECGLAKEEIRRLSREAGLFTWDKPAYAYLATRLPAGGAITQGKRQAAEAAEQYLFSLGITDFHVCSQDGNARITDAACCWNIVLRFCLKLKVQPFEEIGYAKVDLHRKLR